MRYEGILTVKNKFHVFRVSENDDFVCRRGVHLYVVNFFHCPYSPTPKTKI